MICIGISEYWSGKINILWIQVQSIKRSYELNYFLIRLTKSFDTERTQVTLSDLFIILSLVCTRYQISRISDLDARPDTRQWPDTEYEIRRDTGCLYIELYIRPYKYVYKKRLTLLQTRFRSSCFNLHFNVLKILNCWFDISNAFYYIYITWIDSVVQKICIFLSLTVSIIPSSSIGNIKRLNLFNLCFVCLPII